MTKNKSKSVASIAADILANGGHLNKLAKDCAKKHDIETAYRLRQCVADLFQVFSYLDGEKYKTNNFRRWC